MRQCSGMSPELQRISRLSAARRRSVADAGGPPVRFASYDVVRLRSDAEVECFLRSVAPRS
jgi:hypothetical protein